MAGQDLGWYFRTWFFETWTLDHKVAEVVKTGDGTAVTIEDVGQAIGPAEVVVAYEDGSKEAQKVPASHWLSGQRSVVLTFKKGVKEVRIDPRSITLDVNPKNNVWDR